MSIFDINLQVDKDEFNEKKTEYSVSQNNTIEELTLPDYKQYMPVEYTNGDILTDFPNKLNI